MSATGNLKHFPGNCERKTEQRHCQGFGNWDKKWQVKWVLKTEPLKGQCNVLTATDPDYLEYVRPIEDREIYPTPGILLLFSSYSI